MTVPENSTRPLERPTGAYRTNGQALGSGYSLPRNFPDESLQSSPNRADTKNMNNELSPTDRFNLILDELYACDENTPEYAGLQDKATRFILANGTSSSVMAEARMAGFDYAADEAEGR